MDLRNQRLSIIEIQENLRELYKAGWNIALVTPDGIYGSITRSAVREFQKLTHLPASGIVNYPTWTLLTANANEARMERKPSMTISPFNRPLRGDHADRSDQFDLIFIVQLILNESQIYQGVLPMTGVLDEATCEALADFQEKNGIDPTGRLNRITWDALADTYNKYLPQTGEY